MICEKYIINEERGAYLLRYAFEKKQAAMPNVMKRPTVVVCPGGGYSSCSPREAEPVALRYAAKGFHAFILRYSTGWDAKDFAPFTENLYTAPASITGLPAVVFGGVQQVGKAFSERALLSLASLCGKEDK